MKLSARNQLKGKIVEVIRGATTAHVRIDIGGQIVTASITNESADELKLAVGQTAYAIIKASSVMVAVDGAGRTRRTLMAGLSAAALAPRATRAATVNDAAGRAVPIPPRVARVFPAGPPAAILLYTLAPDLLIGWPRPN